MKRSGLRAKQKKGYWTQDTWLAMASVLWAEQDGRCRCERELDLHDYPSPQIAHRVPDTMPNRAKWGISKLYHKNNLELVCGLDCNNRAQVGPARPREQEQIMEECI